MAGKPLLLPAVHSEEDNTIFFRGLSAGFGRIPCRCNLTVSSLLSFNKHWCGENNDCSSCHVLFINNRRINALHSQEMSTTSLITSYYSNQHSSFPPALRPLLVTRHLVLSSFFVSLRSLRGRSAIGRSVRARCAPRPILPSVRVRCAAGLPLAGRCALVARHVSFVRRFALVARPVCNRPVGTRSLRAMSHSSVGARSFARSVCYWPTGARSLRTTSDSQHYHLRGLTLCIF